MQIKEFQSAGAFPFLYSKTDKRKKREGKFHSNQI